jgi:signal transduction histidine kinase
MDHAANRQVDGPEPDNHADPGTRALTHRIGRRIGRLVAALSGMRPGLAVAAIALLVALGWLGVYLADGAENAPPHWFYLPILFAATRFGIAGAVATGAVSGLVAGPLLPQDVSLGIPQTPSDEIVRAIYFLAIGTLMAAIIWRLKESLSKEAEVARRAAELAAHKAAVISTVSHEFRTPLSVLLGSSKMLLGHRDWPEPERTLLEGISGSARRLNDLVAAVLAVSEGPLVAEELVSTAVPVGDIVGRIVAATDPQDTERLRVDIGDEVIWTDPPILEALLRALVDNALKFSPSTSPVEIAVRWSEGDELLQVVVADRGPGIDQRFFPRAFEPFTQQDGSPTRSSGGLGIGLFVAHRLADYLGFNLELRPRGGGGTEACVSVRRSTSQATDADVTSRHSPSAKGFRAVARS